jgi:hypothetical protein
MGFSNGGWCLIGCEILKKGGREKDRGNGGKENFSQF